MQRDSGSIGSLAQARRHMMASMIAVTCLVGLGSCASQKKRTTFSLPSRHAVHEDQLTVLTDQPIDADSQIVRELTLVRDQIRELFDIPPGSRNVVVYLFSDQEHYSRYMRSQHPDLPPRRAFFIGTPQELAVYAYCSEKMYVDLRHEYTHGLLHASVGYIPLWLDEGLAEYFEVGSRQPGGINGEHASGLRYALAHGWRPDLEQLEQLEYVGQMNRKHYQEAWAWIHFLLHEVPHGREIIADYLKDIRLGLDPGSFAARVRTHLPSAEIQLTSYVQTLVP